MSSISYHNMNVAVANDFGMVAALIFENILYWVEKNRANDRNYRDGYYWTYNSRAAMQELFPYLTVRQLRTALDKLEEGGMIVTTSKYNKTNIDRTLWYAITEKGYMYVTDKRVTSELTHHHVNVNIATLFGLPAAVILENIMYWTIYNRNNGLNLHDGHYWTYNKREAMLELFPYLSSKRIRAAVDRLAEDGIIMTSRYNSDPHDRTLWYTVTDKGIALYQGIEYHEEENIDKEYDEYFEVSESPENMESSILTNGKCQNDKWNVPKCQMESAVLTNGRCQNVTAIPNILPNQLPDKLHTYFPATHTRAKNAAAIKEMCYKALHREPVYSEAGIIDKWLEQGIDLGMIEQAILDNEFRKDRLTLKHVDETLTRWCSEGILSENEARNKILDDHCDNLMRFMREHTDVTEEELEDTLRVRSSAHVIREFRDAVEEAYLKKNVRMIFQILNDAQDEVYLYLSPEIRRYALDYAENSKDRTVGAVANRLRSVG